MGSSANFPQNSHTHSSSHSPSHFLSLSRALWWWIGTLPRPHWCKISLVKFIGFVLSVSKSEAKDSFIWWGGKDPGEGGKNSFHLWGKSRLRNEQAQGSQAHGSHAHAHGMQHAHGMEHAHDMENAGFDTPVSWCRVIPDG